MGMSRSSDAWDSLQLASGGSALLVALFPQKGQGARGGAS